MRETHNKTVDLFVLYKHKPVTVSWETWSIMRIEGSCTQVNNTRAGVRRGRRRVELLQPCPVKFDSTIEPTFYNALFNKCRLTVSFLGSSPIVWSYLPHLLSPFPSPCSFFPPRVTDLLTQCSTKTAVLMLLYNKKKKKYKNCKFAMRQEKGNNSSSA